MDQKPDSIADRIYGIIRSCLELTDGLPWCRLRPGERETLGGHLFFRQLEVVGNVADALKLRPLLFPDISTTGEELEEEQRIADALLALAITFLTLGRLYMDNHVKAQNGVTSKTKDILKTIVTGYDHPELCPHLNHERRVGIMVPALQALWEVNQNKGKKPPRNGPTKEEAPLSPKQEQARRRRKEERRSDLYAILESLVASFGRKG